MPVAVRVDRADLIVKASCCLHNFLKRDFTLTYDATLKLRLCRMFSFLVFCGFSRMPVLISMIHILPKFILHKFFFVIIISTINQPDTRQRQNCRPITPTCFQTCQDAFPFKYFIWFDQKLNLLYR